MAATMQRVAANGRVIFMLRRLDEAEVAALFSAATLAVAPYLDILNSGSAFIVYSRPADPGAGPRRDERIATRYRTGLGQAV